MTAALTNKIASYLALLSRQCKVCLRKSYSACRACPIQPAQGLLEEVTATVPLDGPAKRRLQREKLRNDLLAYLVATPDKWHKMTELAAEFNAPQNQIRYQLSLLPVESKGSTRARSYRLKQE